MRKLILLLIALGCLLFFASEMIDAGWLDGSGNRPPHAQAAQRYYDSPETAEARAMRLADARQWHMRWQIFWWSMCAGMPALIFLGGLAAIWRFLMVPAMNARERIPYDPQTGMQPAIRVNVTPWWARLFGTEPRYAVEDGNLAIAPSRSIDYRRGLTVTADSHGVSQADQLAYAGQSWGVQGRVADASSGRGMTKAAAMLSAGVFDAQRRYMETKERLLAARTEPAQAQDQGEPEPAINPQEALERSQEGIVYIGQAAAGRRELAAWDANGASTLGIFGANGTGKTASVATMVALAMLRWGWALHILDGKDAGDWDEFGRHAQVTAIDSRNLGAVMDELWGEYERRKALMSQYRARHYRHLPAQVQAANPQWAILFEEFGATRLRLNNSLRAQLDKFVDILCKEARFTGWHGVFIDQRPTDYTSDMKGNLKAIACFRLRMNQGHAVNAYQADKLANRGEFEMDGARYWAFHAEPLARPFLASLPARVDAARFDVEPPPMVMKGYEPSTNGHERPMNGHNGHSPEVNGMNVQDQEGDAILQTLVSVYERSRSWDTVGEKYFAMKPQGTQAELRRYMSQIDGRAPDAFKGEAHRLYHAYNSSIPVAEIA